ncbi:MAG: phospho-sugar mutase [Weeksellaceae bacterium]|nr:phospho-sugar mutase [Weeksellaceae bacterium]
MKANERAKLWLSESFDAATREEVQKLIDAESPEIEDRFYKNMEFGTGGMRGIVGVGTNRLNRYTLGAATQGLANYLKAQVHEPEIKVAIAHDVRHNSREFMQIVAEILSANGIHVYIFDGFRPTPLLSFAVRELNCHAGIVLTASHNPPEYNGYKVYWNDGAQIVPPHDVAIIEEVNNIEIADIQFDGNESLIHLLDHEVEDAYINACVKYGARKSMPGYVQLKIVFTPLHGTAVAVMPEALRRAGFENVYMVEDQAVPDPNFSTVRSPNPEEPDALKMAIELAEQVQADIVIGTDPDADRLGIAVRDRDGKFVLLNGNQTNTVLTRYLLEEWENEGRIDGNQFIGSTIVTSDIFLDLAERYGVECKLGLTGFKWIGKMIREAEGNQKFICGGEESFGFMVDDFVRDKDSITSTLLACHIAAKTKSQGTSLYNYLIESYIETQLYAEDLISIVKPGMSGAAEIKEMMENWRQTPPESFGGSKVVKLFDYKEQSCRDLTTSHSSTLDLPKSDVLIFYTEDGTKVAARPSGTEPKIKFYFSVKKPFTNEQDFEKEYALLRQKIDKLKEEVS